ncbi:olfactory receptor 1509-like [Microcaecilia unicolor]|uniref:Olfactory receptor n=1 Tax=Microcaecilia unicolor TaxID=1415580 RepID=A0A6P7WNE8_9AMPH|nr:olfactory receptor 1509-like [Microcaecilia unicolor]
MAAVNETTDMQFILLGLSSTPEIQILFFVLFLTIYLLTIVGNLLIVVTIYVDSRLHSPMYFFLSNLSFLDLCLSTVIVPNSLANFLSQSKTISFSHCIAQLFFLHFFGGSEFFHLTLMAYDRYVAICNPLRYTAIMNRSTCLRLVIFTWIGGFFHSFTQALVIIQLPFCGLNEINHFFCDVHPVAMLACSNIFVNELLLMANSGTMSLCCFLVLFISYAYIIYTILNISSAEGRWKAFSTCASHLLVVSLIFGPCVFIYMRSSVTFSADKMVSMFYTLVTPLLNPIIYTLRNEKVKKAMKRLGQRKISFEWMHLN